MQEVSRLERIVKEYKDLSKEGYYNPHKNIFLREIVDLSHSIHFLLTKYYRDDKMKQLRTQHTEAMHEELVNNDHMPYGLAVALSRSTPMPIQNNIIKGISSVIYGALGPGRVYEEAFNRVPKYMDTPRKWVFRGCIVADTVFNNPTGTFIAGIGAWGLELGTKWTYHAITGDNVDIPIRNWTVAGYIIYSYFQTFKDAILFEYTGKYQHNKMNWTRIPGAIYMFASYKYHKYIRAQQTRKSTHILKM